MALRLAPVIGIAIGGFALALQGWRTRPPAFDMMAFFFGAENLLRHGVLPVHGDVSSYGSFHPPGPAWLMAPGMLIFDDPRLYEKVGSGVLHVGALVGIFLVAREAFGLRVAYLSAAIYGVSGLGLAFAGSLWPIGHPFFYVWTTYFTMRWASRNEEKYLAAALIVLALGMYDAMAIAPLAFILPVVWLAYHPRMSARALAVAGLVALIVWYPYLRLEADRGFADIRSQFGLQNIAPANFADAWCDPGLELRHVDTGGEPTVPAAIQSPTTASPLLATTPSSIIERLVARLAAIPGKLLANFSQVVSWPVIALLLLLMVMSSLAAAGLAAPAILRQIARIPWARRRKAGGHGPEGLTQEQSILLVALLVPWSILLAVAEADRPERFFWLWPLQAIWLGVFFSLVLPARRRPKTAVLLGVLLVAVLVVNPLQAHLGSWWHDGFAGSDPEEVQVVDYVASQLQASGQSEAAIGYDTYVYEFMPKYHIIDPTYKVGADLDLLFRYMHQITNSDQCAEGVSASDEYRIVQTRPKSGEDEPRLHFLITQDSTYRLVRGFDLYEVFKRHG